MYSSASIFDFFCAWLKCVFSPVHPQQRIALLLCYSSWLLGVKLTAVYCSTSYNPSSETLFSKAPEPSKEKMTELKLHCHFPVEPLCWCTSEQRKTKEQINHAHHVHDTFHKGVVCTAYFYWIHTLWYFLFQVWNMQSKHYEHKHKLQTACCAIWPC